MKYGFLGLGNMGAAILRGMVAGGYLPGDILGYDNDAPKARLLAEELNISLAAGLPALLAAADCVVLAVKPQVLPGLLPQIKEHAVPGKLYISIAAGRPLAFFEAGLGAGAAVVRVMPNINALVGAASSCFCANANVGAEQKQLVVDIFETVGSIIELPEHLIAAFSGIAGASPAFTYMYIDSLARAAVRAGMPKAQALAAAAAAVEGSARMVRQAGLHPWELVDRVCSPGGTTIEGVHALQALGFESAVEEAVAAVIERDEELAQQAGQ